MTQRNRPLGWLDMFAAGLMVPVKNENDFSILDAIFEKRVSIVCDGSGKPMARYVPLVRLPEVA